MSYFSTKGSTGAGGESLARLGVEPVLQGRQGSDIRHQQDAQLWGLVEVIELWGLDRHLVVDLSLSAQEL